MLQERHVKTIMDHIKSNGSNKYSVIFIVGGYSTILQELKNHLNCVAQPESLCCNYNDIISYRDRGGTIRELRTDWPICDVSTITYEPYGDHAQKILSVCALGSIFNSTETIMHRAIHKPFKEASPCNIIRILYPYDYEVFQ
uniref:Uncharacterized protein n=1 Tax=viral metagenome TaxID=1070528 RepID=A0A6C0J9W7_9ZZZZ